MTVISPYTNAPIAPVAVPEAPKEQVKIPNDIRPRAGRVLLVRLGESDGYWSEETGIVKVQDDLADLRSPIAQVVRIGEEPVGVDFAVGDYVFVNHSLLQPIPLGRDTLWIAPFSAVLGVFFWK